MYTWDYLTHPGMSQLRARYKTLTMSKMSYEYLGLPGSSYLVGELKRQTMSLLQYRSVPV